MTDQAEQRYIRADSIARELWDAEDEIREGFSMRNGIRSSVPCVERHKGLDMVSRVQAYEAAVELIREGRCTPEFMAVMQHSGCPLVEAMRKAMANRWIADHAKRIVELRA